MKWREMTDKQLRIQLGKEIIKCQANKRKLEERQKIIGDIELELRARGLKGESNVWR